jgi:hypothetical protein
MTAVIAPPGKLVVGMSQRAAAGLLRGSGAEKTKLDGATVSTPLRSAAVYKLVDGKLLVVGYTRKSRTAPYHVSGLTVCKKPDVPKVKRQWLPVTEVTP